MPITHPQLSFTKPGGGGGGERRKKGNYLKVGLLLVPDLLSVLALASFIRELSKSHNKRLSGLLIAAE